jgi:hypothetical protein
MTSATSPFLRPLRRPGPALAAAACLAVLGIAQVVDTAPSPKRTVFVHQVVIGTGGNVCATFAGDTVIDHPMANGNPNAIILVTPNQGPTSANGILGLPDVTQVYYDDANFCGNALDRWVIKAVVPGSALTTHNRFNIVIERP